MAGRALVEGTKSLIVFLVRAIVFPLTWLWAMGIAKRHSNDDPAAPKKVIVAIVAGLIAAPGIGYMIYDFQEDSRTNMYSELEGRLNQVLGNATHADQGTTKMAKMTQITVLTDNLAKANDRMVDAKATGNLSAYESAVADRATFEASLALAQHEFENAERYEARLSEEATFFTGLIPTIRAQNDAGIRNAVAARAVASSPGIHQDASDALLSAEKDLTMARMADDKAQAAVLAISLLRDMRALTADEQAELDELQADADETAAKHAAAQTAADQARADAAAAGIEFPVPADVYNGANLPSRTDRALAIKSSAEADMGSWMLYLIYPGLIGVFYAPLFFALGNIMAHAWDPSESVGFKKYPGASLALFLFFGAFGWPSLLFSAWGFKDIEERSQTGQISL